MGNGIGNLSRCFDQIAVVSRRHDIAVILSDPLDEGLGHSFCYVPPDPSRLSSSKIHSEEPPTIFRSISGASVSANTSTPLSTSLLDVYPHSTTSRASVFESSTSFASIPLQPVPRGWANSGPLSRNFDGLSGPIERGFLSGPIERGFMSGPIDKSCDQLQRSLSHHEVLGFKPKTKKGSVIINLKRAITKMVSRAHPLYFSASKSRLID